MERELMIATPGLVTDPGPLGAPEGALYEAENVVIPRPGNIQPRGRITHYNDATASGTTPLHVNYWQSTTFVWYNSGSFPVRKNLSSSLTGPTSLTAGKTWSAATRDRLLFTSDQGVYSIDSTSATTCRRAGLPRPFAPDITIGAGTGWLTNGNATAYRAVYVRYVNGTPIYSAPSGYSLYPNTSGAGVPPLVYVWLSSEMVAGDIVHVYRSPLQSTSPALPSDEMRLRNTFTLTSTDISNGYASFTDTLADAAWNGPALYSNESQQGILNSNYRPDYATDVAYYNGMAFYAGAKSRQKLVLNVTSAAVSSNQPEQTLGGRVFTGATTLGSAVITGVAAADIAYLVVGQYLTIDASVGGSPGNNDVDFAANTKVVSWNSGAGTVTVSTNALRTAAAHAVQVWDWVQVYDGTNTREIYANVSATTVSTAFKVGTNPANPEIAWTTNHLLSGSSSPSLVALYVDGTGAYGQTWTFEALSYPGTTFTVKSSKPLAFNRYVDRTTGITSAQDGGDFRLTYSKVYEPEAVPILQYVDIGSSVNVIHRVMKLRDSLFVFTSEGLYRVTGTDPSELVVDQFDPTCVLWDRRLLASSHDQIWAFTTGGPAAVSDGGVRSICTNVRRMFDQDWDLATGATSGSTQSVWACADQAHDLVIFGAKRLVGVSSPYVWRGYVYNVTTNAWTNWSSERESRQIYCSMATLPFFGSQLGAASYAFTENAPRTGDSLGSVAVVSAASGATITINAGSGWTPTVGDAVGTDSEPFHVITVNSATQFVLDRNPFVSPGANLNVFEGVAHRIKWQAKTMGDPSLLKRYANAWLMFERWVRGYDMTLTWESYNNRTYWGSGNEKLDNFTIASLTELSAYTPATSEYPLQVMREVPSEIAEDWAVRFGFKMLRATAWWVLGAAALSYDHLSDRTGHR